MGLSVIGGADGPTAIFLSGSLGSVGLMLVLFLIFAIVAIWFFYRPKESRLNIDNTYIDYVAFGRGEKNLVLIPGLTLRNVKGSAIPLAFMYRIFIKEYRVYVLDKRAVVPNVYDIKELADDLHASMIMLGIEKADVFGVSQGGMVAQYLAVNYPESVNKLVLGVTAAKVNPVIDNAIQKWVALSEQNHFEGIVEDMLENMYSESYVKKYRWLFPALTKLSKPKDMKRFMVLANACLTCNIFGELEKIKCPVLVIGGKQDKIVTGEASEEIAKKIGCEVYMYEELGHSAYEEAGDFNKRVYEFLTKQ